MAFVTIDVVPDPHGSRYYEVTVKQGKEVLGFWNVPDEELGREQVLKAIKTMLKKHNPDVNY